MKRYALLLSGGIGSRLSSSTPKQYLQVNVKMVILYSLATLLKDSEIDRVWIVAAEEWQDRILAGIREEGLSTERFGGFAKPGTSRQGSIRNGLKAILESVGEPADEDCVLIHDAARPLVSEQTIHTAFRLTEEHDGAMPVLPMKDTVYLSDSKKERAAERLDRDRIFAGQAPEAFRLKLYDAANARYSTEELDQVRGSSEPAINAGMDIAIFPGEEENFKITTEEDLERFEMLLKKRNA